MAGRHRILSIAMAIIMLLIAGCAADTAFNPSNPAKETQKQQEQGAQGQSSGEKMQLVVYFATKDAMRLASEKREVPKTSSPAHEAVELLIKGPADSAHMAVMPSEVKLRGLEIRDHVAYVDFNDKFVKNNPGGTTTEMLLMAAITNTLTEFPEIHKVRIQVEGKTISTYGHVDLSDPMVRETDLIEKR